MFRMNWVSNTFTDLRIHLQPGQQCSAMCAFHIWEVTNSTKIDHSVLFTCEQQLTLVKLINTVEQEIKLSGIKFSALIVHQILEFNYENANRLSGSSNFQLYLLFTCGQPLKQLVEI